MRRAAKTFKRVQGVRGWEALTPSLSAFTSSPERGLLPYHEPALASWVASLSPKRREEVRLLLQAEIFLTNPRRSYTTNHSVLDELSFPHLLQALKAYGEAPLLGRDALTLPPWRPLKDLQVDVRPHLLPALKSEALLEAYRRHYTEEANPYSLMLYGRVLPTWTLLPLVEGKLLPAYGFPGVVSLYEEAAEEALTTGRFLHQEEWWRLAEEVPRTGPQPYSWLLSLVGNTRPAVYITPPGPVL